METNAQESTELVATKERTHPAMKIRAMKRWQKLVLLGIVVLAVVVIVVLTVSSSNPLNRTKRNMETAVALKVGELVNAYADPENADSIYKNRYIKLSGQKWLGYSADGDQNFHVWEGAEKVDLHNRIFDVCCAFPSTKYYRDLSPYYGQEFAITLVGKCVGVEDGHIKLVDCILVTDIN